MDADIDAIDAEVRQFVEREERANDDATLREAHAQVFGTEKRSSSREASFEQRFASWARGEEARREDFEGKSRTPSRQPPAGAQKRHELLRDGHRPDTEARALLWDTGSIASGVPTSRPRTGVPVHDGRHRRVPMPTTKIQSDVRREIMYFPRVNAHGIATQVIAQGTAIGGTDPTFLRCSSTRTSTASSCRSRTRRSPTKASTSSASCPERGPRRRRGRRRRPHRRHRLR
jgi:hypothetical protein